MLDNLIKLQEPYLHCDYNDELNIEKICLGLAAKDSYKLIVSTIYGENCSTSKELFKEFATKFKFPKYFGNNWDALDECINDLDWIETDGYLLLIENVDKILPNDDEGFLIFIKVLSRATKDWSNGNNDYVKPFHIVFRCKEENKYMLTERLKKVGINKINIIR